MIKQNLYLYYFKNRNTGEMTQIKTGKVSKTELFKINKKSFCNSKSNAIKSISLSLLNKYGKGEIYLVEVPVYLDFENEKEYIEDLI